MAHEHFSFTPIGYVSHEHGEVPRHWSVSDYEGKIIINPEYSEGLRDIKTGDIIVVLFCFHKSPSFTSERLIAKPPHLGEERGVFSTCSPVRPNPIGLSYVEVMDIDNNVIYVRRLDMLDGTPVLDIKPYIPYAPLEQK